nr:MAG TPA: hypothetical protein [Caudoviricetes sp.]
MNIKFDIEGYKFHWRSKTELLMVNEYIIGKFERPDKLLTYLSKLYSDLLITNFYINLTDVDDKYTDVYIYPSRTTVNDFHIAMQIVLNAIERFSVNIRYDTHQRIHGVYYG